MHSSTGQARKRQTESGHFGGLYKPTFPEQPLKGAVDCSPRRESGVPNAPPSARWGAEPWESDGP